MTNRFFLLTISVVMFLGATALQDKPPVSPDDPLSSAWGKTIDYFAKTQKEDGSWDTSDPTEKRFHVPGSKRLDHYQCIDTRLCVAGQAGLCLLADGSSPEKGRYATHLAKALAFVLDKVEDPDFGKSNHGAFSVPFVALFLCELLAVPGRLTEEQKTAVRLKLEKVTGAILAGQKIEKTMGDFNGAWGYGLGEGVAPGQGQSARRKQPASCTSMMALLIARDVKAEVPQANLEQGLAYIINTSITGRGDFAYQTRDAAPSNYGGYTRTAAALYVLLRMGREKSDEFKNGMDWLKKNHPKKDAEGHRGTFVPSAYFFGALLMSQGDPAERDAYAASTLKDMLKDQESDGSWSKTSGLNPPAYKTALRALAIAVSRDKLAIFRPVKK